VTFRGEVTPDHVFEAICSEFETLPVKCKDWYNKVGLVGVLANRLRKNRGATVNFSYVVVIISAVLLCLFGAFFMYRRKLNDVLEREKAT